MTVAKIWKSALTLLLLAAFTASAQGAGSGFSLSVASVLGFDAQYPRETQGCTSFCRSLHLMRMTLLS